MPKNTTRKHRRLNAIDYFIIIAAVLCIAGAVFRFAVHKAGGSLSSPVVLEDYVVSFKIEDIRNTSTEYIVPGEEFYIESTKQFFGTVKDNVSVTPAQFFIEDENGNYIPTFAPENGDATRVDARGTFLVNGYMSESGFLLGGSFPLAANKQLDLRSKNLSITVIITAIAKAS